MTESGSLSKAMNSQNEFAEKKTRCKMSEERIYVYLSLNNQDELVGYLYPHTKGQTESSSFKYADSWLNNPERFSIDPFLHLGAGTQYTPKALFGAISDSAPDRWGETLMRRFEQSQAKKENRTPRQLQKIDYLLLVNDEARQGALRFKKDTTSDFLFPPKVKPIPPLLMLPELLTAAEHIEEHSETANDLRLLLEPGSSLGGARPKASVLDANGILSIAKFPKKDDSQNIVLWEAVALTLAKSAGITVPNWQLQTVLNKPVLIINRFDRNKNIRIPFVSAITMLGACDGESGYSYMQIADIIRQYGSNPTEDMQELWRRIVFSICISNTDDHLRNHGFLKLDPHGWRLSPVYDINPNPEHTGFLHTNITETESTANLENALSVAHYFNLKPPQANQIISQVQTATSNWHQVAKKFKLSKREIDYMERAFIPLR